MAATDCNDCLCPAGQTGRRRQAHRHVCRACEALGASSPPSHAGLDERSIQAVRLGTGWGSSESAVWGQLLEAETIGGVSDSCDESSVTILADLVKCFERVRLHHVLYWGCKHQMPVRLLRMILTTYSMARAIVVDGCFSETTETVTAIVPGSAFAIHILHCILLYPCDHCVDNWPQLRLAKYVDDLSLSVKGCAADVVMVTMECV